MRIPVAILIMAALTSACDSPSPALRGANPEIVEIDGSRFRIFHAPGLATVEAHRISFETRPSRIATFEKAFRAIELSTGCQVRTGTLRGDQAIIIAEVDCS